MASTTPPPASTPTPDPYPSLSSTPLRMSYRIARGEQGVLTFEPYKSLLLPLWRFKTAAIARASSSELWARFLEYDGAGDFVGMDMSRKYIQMGMTRAKRYANYRGGRKYAVPGSRGGGRGKSEVLERSGGHEGQREKEEASGVFREVWERCRRHEGYQRKKVEFVKEQKKWDRVQKLGESGRKKKKREDGDEDDG